MSWWYYFYFSSILAKSYNILTTTSCASAMLCTMMPFPPFLAQPAQYTRDKPWTRPLMFAIAPWEEYDNGNDEDKDYGNG